MVNSTVLGSTIRGQSIQTKTFKEHLCNQSMCVPITSASVLIELGPEFAKGTSDPQNKEAANLPSRQNSGKTGQLPSSLLLPFMYYTKFISSKQAFRFYNYGRIYVVQYHYGQRL